MRNFRSLLVLGLFGVVAACGKADAPADSGSNSPAESAAVVAEEQQTVEVVTSEVVQLAPGLSMRLLQAGEGETASTGDIAIVHYTGWLFDDQSPGNKGQKFDSSVDRDQHFQFPLGAGRVIKGWDQGVVGMKVGEKRELTIAPEMGYGQRGAGGVIPPGATLIFDVELARLQSTKPQVDLPDSPAGQ